MRRGFTRILAAAMAVSLVALPSIPALAHTSPEPVHEIDAEGGHGYLTVGFRSFDAAEECIHPGSCPEREDVSFVHLDITDAMSNYDEDFSFYVSDSEIGSTVTLWYACLYDENNFPMWCYHDDQADWGMLRDVSDEHAEKAEAIRLMPVKPGPVAWHLKLQVR